VAPAWAPDGAQLAFLRIDPSTDAVANQFDEDPPAPFAVMLTPVSVLAPHRVWSSPGGDGFARQWRSRTTAPLAWLDGQRLALLSEHDGWQHVYALSGLSGGTSGVVTDLTPGRCEVDYADVIDTATVVVSDNCAGVDRRRLVRVHSETGVAVALTPANGLSIQPVAFDHGQRLVWRQAEQQLQTIRVLAGGREIAPEPPTEVPFPGVTEESLALTAADGIVTNAQLFHPVGPGPHPAIIFLHGGPQRQTFAAAATSAFYSRFGWMNRALAARGYVVMQVNYRSGTGQGRDFRRIRGVARNGAGELADVLAARAWLAGRPEVAGSRIGLWGDSWGGWLTALALARHSDLFRSGVVISGVYDLSETSFGPTLDPQARALAKSSSAAGWIDQWRSPVLIVHGERDNTVPVSQALEMQEALRRRHRDVTVLTFPREGHALQLERDWKLMFERASGFLDRTLGP
jgi:dipeptidyl aminopeptidase/acylaminoacyl peptidase